jgi:hypothetical protein
MVSSSSVSLGSVHAAQARAVAEERSSGERVSLRDLPPGALLVHVLGVDYVHTRTEEKGDLYLTAAGFRLAEHLQPRNWHELEWFRSQRMRLEGTALVYAVPTRPVDGENLGLVVKFSRVGERVPIDTAVIENVLSCEFNGPFEEFALVEELRRSRRGPADDLTRLQVPLAIYVPPDETQPSQSGRFQWRIARKVAQHPGVEIDILRDYIMVYGWLSGVDAWEAHTMGLLSETEARDLTERATREIRARGFTVLDMKPNHVIVEPGRDGRLPARNGRLEYGLVDFELLERTAEYWQELSAEREATYEKTKKELLAGEVEAGKPAGELPANLRAVEILGVRYLEGHTGSTGGMLWVVGSDPELFDFYLPERWRTTPHIRLRETHESYVTTSKDHVRLVWKVSSVGERPEAAFAGTEGFRLLAQGVNSPFEEVAAAWWLRRRGIPTALPRAIYRTGHRSQLDESLYDPSRYRSHARYLSSEGTPILETRRNYITLWDYWCGPETLQLQQDSPVFRSVSAAEALERSLLEAGEAAELSARFRERLAAEGVEAVRLDGSDLLVALCAEDRLVRDGEGRPEACLCSFRYLRLPDPVSG